jgi:hypothetical protein
VQLRRFSTCFGGQGYAQGEAMRSSPHTACLHQKHPGGVVLSPRDRAAASEGFLLLAPPRVNALPAPPPSALAREALSCRGRRPSSGVGGWVVGSSGVGGWVVGSGGDALDRCSGTWGSCMWVASGAVVHAAWEAAAAAAAAAVVDCAMDVRFCRYRFPATDLNSKATLIKPVSNFCFLYSEPVSYPTAPLIPLYPNSPVGENRWWQNLTSVASAVDCAMASRRRTGDGVPLRRRPPAPYCDPKVANRDVRVLALRDREWLLNDGQIQNPSVQS